jgi:hypothetical protein
MVHASGETARDSLPTFHIARPREQEQSGRKPEPGAAFAGKTEKQLYTTREAEVVAFLRQDGRIP